MTDDKMKEKADELWLFFEQNVFKNDGEYSYNTNLVFAFADYVDGLSDDNLSDFLGSDDENLIIKFRQMINAGIEEWLSAFAKTFMIM